MGPFYRHGPRLPPGLVGLKALAELVGIGEPTIVRWVAKGVVPPPDFVTAAGRKIWQVSTVTRWLEDSDLDECEACGARCLSVSRHRTLAHGRP